MTDNPLSRKELQELWDYAKENTMTEQELKDINSFTWNASCTEGQIKRMKYLREAGKALCQQIIKDVPNSADRSAGIRSLRLAIMQCNLAIAHENYK